jgi:hypothetical protein
MAPATHDVVEFVIVDFKSALCDFVDILREFWQIHKNINHLFGDIADILNGVGASLEGFRACNERLRVRL